MKQPITYLDLKKYKRFFAFGCSFTHYFWPTWADIIGREIPYYENWGKGAAGNQFIFNSIIECNLRNKFNEDDLVIAMWSSCSREDRYLNGNWLVAATDNRDDVYGKSWMDKFGKEGKGNMIRDFASISAIQQILENGKSDWINFNGPPLIRFNIDKASDDINKKIITLDEIEKKWASLQKDLSLGKNVVDYYIEGEDVIDLYRDIFVKIKEPLLDSILKNPNRPNLGDKHPTPNEALNYINRNLPNSLDAKEYAEYWTAQVYKIKTKGVLPIEFTPNNPKRF